MMFKLIIEALTIAALMLALVVVWNVGVSLNQIKVKYQESK